MFTVREGYPMATGSRSLPWYLVPGPFSGERRGRGQGTQGLGSGSGWGQREGAEKFC